MQVSATARPIYARINPSAILVIIAGFFFNSTIVAQSDKLEFFETRIRPVLIEHCYPCHNSIDIAEGGLAVDWKTGIRSESSQGTAVVPGRPDESLLLKVIKHEINGLEMPDGRAKLSPEIIADLETWVRDGAHDPRLHIPTPEELEAATSWESVFQRRKNWWCFQPLNVAELPASTHWSDHPIDRFIARKHAENQLANSPRADRRTLIRRLSYALTGLPPSPQQVEEFANDGDPQAYEKLVDRLMASPRFGERWARHWMDLVRYADSHGSEGDPAIPNAFQYRDYLIRALNADVPYDQLIREHIAGDLLPDPRINHDLEINESAIGTAHLRLVFHGFAPTDALDEKVRFTDDQINVLTKAFQALTVSCARCHDHKFDAISQADYYALFGVLGSCRPAMQDVNLPEKQSHYTTELSHLKTELHRRIADYWLQELQSTKVSMAERLSQLTMADPDQQMPLSSVLEPWHSIHSAVQSGAAFDVAWRELENSWRAAGDADLQSRQISNAWHWDLGTEQGSREWFAFGKTLNDGPCRPGEFTVAVDGDQVIDTIFPASMITHQLSTLHRGVLGSPSFHLDDSYDAWLRVSGGGQSSIRYVVQNYPRDGTVYPINNINRSDWYWHRFNLNYWSGDSVHLELATAKDAPLKVNSSDRSWFGIREVIVRQAGSPAPAEDSLEVLQPLIDQCRRAPPESSDDLARAYEAAIKSAVERWRLGNADDADAVLLNACLSAGLLENSLVQTEGIAELVHRYREMESKIPPPTRIPGVVEADAKDQPLFQRGNHKQPLEPVRRRYLQVIDDTPFATAQSGRLELANAIADPSNPLTARVIVNRLWHYLFGQGIVATPDNFGQLGELPSHPELLDYLADRMIQQGWSIKDTIRFIVNSETWCQSSKASPPAQERDPQNRWLTHANIRRLDAEAIRDSMLLLSGEMDFRMYGPGDAANSDSRRRSVYVQSRRNALDEFLQVFDAPVPFSTAGRRNQTNVPAQSLAMLNHPRVLEWARRLGQSVATSAGLGPEEQPLRLLFHGVLGRPPNDVELAWLLQYHARTKEELAQRADRRQLLERQLEDCRQQLEGIVAPAKARLLAEKTGSDEQPLVEPVAHWDFTQGPEDGVGNLDVKLHGDAQLTADGLVLGGSGFAMTAPFTEPLNEKTMEVLVKLESLDQRGGGVMTVQDLAGHVFDSIVFGEQEPLYWMAGSNFFQRTLPFGGAPESSAAGAPVHIVITYDADGTIRCYRNGSVYGKPYRKSEIATFHAQKGQVVFGLRHGTSVAQGRMFSGTVVTAGLYNRALSAEEVSAAANGQPFVSHDDIIRSLANSQRQQIEKLERQSVAIHQQLTELGDELPESESWTLVAHALFNLKEFIYLR